MVLYLIQLSFIILICIILTFLYFKFTHISAIPRPSIAPPPSHIKYRIALLSITALFYCAHAFLLSLSWLGGDDFFFPAPGESFSAHFHHVAWKYCNWVSRFGEIIVGVTGVSENRWQHFTLTPLFISLLPYAIFRLVRSKHESIFSTTGIIFYVLTLSLLLIQPALSVNWRNFRCYAAAANYLWPLLGITFFISFYRYDQVFDKKSHLLSIPVMFALGLYAGWSIECISCFLLPAIIIVGLIKLKHKRFYLPQFSGLLGVLLGSFLLFGSPALAKRATSASESCSIAVADLPFSEAFDLALSITPQNIHMLSGGAITAYIGDFPLILRALFFPSLMREYIPCCFWVLCACFILIAIIYFSKLQNKRNIILIALGGIAASFLSCASYLTSCIPNRMSFLPPLFILICVLGFLTLKASRKYSSTLAILSLSYWLYILIPTTIEAYDFMPARQAQMQLIYQQIANGEQNILLPNPFPYQPKDTLHIIRAGVFHEDPTAYPNHLARTYFKVNSIRSAAPPSKQE